MWCRNRPQKTEYPFPLFSSSFQICSVQYLSSYLPFSFSSHRLSTPGDRLCHSLSKLLPGWTRHYHSLLCSCATTPSHSSLSSQAVYLPFEATLAMTTIRMTNVWETHVGGITTHHYAVSRRIAVHHFPFFFPSLLTSIRSQVAVVLLLAPHPSILYVLLNYHYLTLHAPYYFIAHLIIIYTLSFLAFSSLIACVARDPGPIPDVKAEEVAHDVGGGGGDDMSLEDALLSAPPSDDYTQPGKWCRICWRPKPERAHHCSQCGRCVLKMGALPVVCPSCSTPPPGGSRFPFLPRSPLSLDGCKMHSASSSLQFS